MSETKYVPVAEVADLFGVSRETVHAWTRGGLIRAVRIGRTVRIPRSELERLEAGAA